MRVEGIEHRPVERVRRLGRQPAVDGQRGIDGHVLARCRCRKLVEERTGDEVEDRRQGDEIGVRDQVRRDAGSQIGAERLDRDPPAVAVADVGEQRGGMSQERRIVVDEAPALRAGKLRGERAQR